MLIECVLFEISRLKNSQIWLKMPIQPPSQKKWCLLGVVTPKHDFFYHRDPQKALPYAQIRVLSHQTVIGLLVWPVGVSKNTKKDSTQKVTENSLLTPTLFPSSHINQILHVGSYPEYLCCFWVSLKSVKKCGSCGGWNFGFLIDLAHRLYNSLLLSHKPWFQFFLNLICLLDL